MSFGVLTRELPKATALAGIAKEAAIIEAAIDTCHATAFCCVLTVIPSATSGKPPGRSSRGHRVRPSGRAWLDGLLDARIWSPYQQPRLSRSEERRVGKEC